MRLEIGIIDGRNNRAAFGVHLIPNNCEEIHFSLILRNGTVGTWKRNLKKIGHVYNYVK